MFRSCESLWQVCPTCRTLGVHSFDIFNSFPFPQCLPTPTLRVAFFLLSQDCQVFSTLHYNVAETREVQCALFGLQALSTSRPRNCKLLLQIDDRSNPELCLRGRTCCVNWCIGWAQPKSLREEWPDELLFLTFVCPHAGRRRLAVSVPDAGAFCCPCRARSCLCSHAACPKLAHTCCPTTASSWTEVYSKSRSPLLAGGPDPVQARPHLRSLPVSLALPLTHLNLVALHMTLHPPSRSPHSHSSLDRRIVAVHHCRPPRRFRRLPRPSSRAHRRCAVSSGCPGCVWPKSAAANPSLLNPPRPALLVQQVPTQTTRERPRSHEAYHHSARLVYR